MKNPENPHPHVQSQHQPPVKGNSLSNWLFIWSQGKPFAKEYQEEFGGKKPGSGAAFEWVIAKQFNDSRWGSWLEGLIWLIFPAVLISISSILSEFAKHQVVLGSVLELIEFVIGCILLAVFAWAVIAVTTMMQAFILHYAAALNGGKGKLEKTFAYMGWLNTLIVPAVMIIGYAFTIILGSGGSDTTYATSGLSLWVFYKILKGGYGLDSNKAILAEIEAIVAIIAIVIAFVLCIVSLGIKP